MSWKLSFVLCASDKAHHNDLHPLSTVNFPSRSRELEKLFRLGERSLKHFIIITNFPTEFRRAKLVIKQFDNGLNNFSKALIIFYIKVLDVDLWYATIV